MRTPRFLVIVATFFVISLFVWRLLRNTNQNDGGGLTEDQLRFVHSGTTEDDQFWRETIADFGRDTGIRVAHDFIAAQEDPYGARLRQDWTSHPSPDIALLPVAALRELSGPFEVCSHTNGDPDNSLPFRGVELEPTGLEAFTHHGALRGQPVSGTLLLIYANRKGFEKAAAFHGHPIPLPGDHWTLEQFLRTAEMLTCDFDRDGIIDQFGSCLPAWNDYLPILWSFGAEMTNEDATQWTLSGPEAEAAMRFYRQLATGDRVCPTLDEVPQLPRDAAFLSGKTAMCVGGPEFASVLDQTDLAMHYVVVPMPGGPAGRSTPISWNGLVVRESLEPNRRSQAMRLVEYFLSKPVQDRLARSGRALPARVDALQAFVAPDAPRRQPFVDALTYSRVPTALPGLESLGPALSRHFGDAVNPERAFEASAMLDALARDPAIVVAFPPTPSSKP